MAEREKGIIERGQVAEVKDGSYIIASLDRDGIVTPPLLPISETDMYLPGDKVFYFYFSDGSGRVICRFS